MEKFFRFSKFFLLGSAVFAGLTYLLPIAVEGDSRRFKTDPKSYDTDSKAELAENLRAEYLIPQNAQSAFEEFREENIDRNGFYIRIDKVKLFKAVVLNVDPRYKDQYVQSWEKGVSHGKFTATPDQIGITYLFAHAVSNKSKAESENAWFSYLDQLTNGDEVIIYYKGTKYTYSVNEILAVNPDATGFYTGVSSVSKVRLQFCGPPTGSLAKRTLVDGILVSSEAI